MQTSVESRTISRVTWIGLVANTVLCALKFAAGIFGHSQTMIADAVHSLSDSVTDIAILVGSAFWSKPSDENHPHGHRRIETLVTLFIGVALIIAAVGLGWNALKSIQEVHREPPKLIALYAALLSIVVKEMLYRWTMAQGIRVKSKAMQANAWHHRSDAFSSIPAAIAVSGAIWLPNLVYLDHIGAIVISVFILQVATRIMLPGMKELFEAGAPPAVSQELLKIAQETGNVIEVHGLRTRYLGSRLHVDLHVVVDGEITVIEGHEIAENVSRRLLEKGENVMDVIVHIEPREEIENVAG